MALIRNNKSVSAEEAAAIQEIRQRMLKRTNGDSGRSITNEPKGSRDLKEPRDARPIAKNSRDLENRAEVRAERKVERPSRQLEESAERSDRSERNPARTQSSNSNNSNSSINQPDQRQVTINFNPVKIAKILGVLLLLGAVFTLGRFSTNINLFGSADGVSAAVTSDETNSPESAQMAEAENTEAAPAEGTTPETTAETVPEAVEEQTEEPVEEAVVTTYGGAVTLELGKFYTKDNYGEEGIWGKISKFDYSIKNGAGGIIKPHHFLMMVEGYGDDFMKEVPVDFKSQSIASGTYSYTAVIPDGFTYHKNTVGKLTEVTITLILYDGEKQVIDSKTKEVDLS